MLISFSIENFLSFKEKNTLTMLPDALKEKESNLHIPYLYDMNARLLKSVSIYGHNSHGKSNFIKAYLFFRDFILSSAEQNRGESIDVENFRLNSETTNLPSFFEVIFYIRDTKYRYGFKVTSKKVVEEWLYYAQPKVRENHLFHRFEQEIKTSRNWQKETGIILDKAIMFTKNYQLLLSTLIASNEIPSPVNKIADWFKGNIIVPDISEEKYLKYALMILSLERYRPLINKLIDKADLGFITIIDKIDTLLGKKLDISEDLLRVWYKTELKEFSLYTQHNFYDEAHKLIDTVKFEFLKSESSGTLRFLIVACLLCQAIKQEQLLIIDEIDSKFHSLLLEAIILFYNDPKINVSGSQMLFTTHNTILLNEVLRRDQIFFIEKNEFGESSLQKAHSAKNPIRIDSSIEKDYRKGKLGGVSKKIKQGENQSKLDF
jgi:hypothetical protein